TSTSSASRPSSPWRLWATPSPAALAVWLARPPAGHGPTPSPGDDTTTSSSRGNDLADAQAAFDQRTNEPVIAFRFNNAGARAFARYTAENVGRPVALVR